MFELFKSVVDTASNVVKVAIAPIEVAVDFVGAAIQPIVDATSEIVNDVKSLKD